MRFALIGDHPDGLDLVFALITRGHSLAGVCGVFAEETWQRLGTPTRVSDPEELLAAPDIEVIIVAGSPGNRPAQLRRAIQSEHHVVCVHPADEKVDTAYEAALMAGDTKFGLIPLLPEGMHPAIERLASKGPFRVITWERSATGEALDNATVPGMKPSIPGWDVLRVLGGEIAEVSSLTGPEELSEGEPVLVGGTFEKGGLFQMTLIPQRRVPLWRLVGITTQGEAELTFPQGWNGPAILEWRDPEGKRHEDYFERWDAGPALAVQVEALAARQTSAPTWQDEVRCLELDDAARGSTRYRRSNRMEYQEATEEVGFKGTMTLVGCSLLWTVLILAILASRYPWVGWLILPLLLMFIGLQMLRYAVPPKK